VRLEWIAEDENGTPLSVAIFEGIDADTLYSGAPIAIDPPGNVAVLPVLPGEPKLFYGLALPLGVGQYSPVGVVLRIRPGAPIYVDSLADPAIADGLTPGTAFPNPNSGILTALVHGGGNVWIKGGDYLDQALTLFPGVDLYGGFGPAFDLQDRDREQFPSALHGVGSLSLIALNGGAPGCIFDGLALLGDHLGVIGVEAVDTRVELRCLEIQDCSSRGIKLLSTFTDRSVDAQLVSCRSLSNGAHGMHVGGPYEIEMEGCVFSGNVQQGVEFGPLVAPEGVPVGLKVRGCQFVSNGKEGLQVKLGSPPFTGPLGSSFDVYLENSSFEANGGTGLDYDIDFDLDVGWSANLLARGLLSRANAGPGVQLDLDWTSTTFFQRLLSTSNAGDGLWVSSETMSGFVGLSASALVGNHGAGLHASEGNMPIYASHCLLGGNALGGALSEVVESGAVSSSTWLQANPWSGVRTHACVDASDPSAPICVRAPREYLRVIGWNGAQPVLESLGGLLAGDLVELADDGVARTVSALGTNTAQLAPAPQPTAVPTLLAVFDPGPDVEEDYRVVPGSAAFGVGMTPPGGPPVDAGPFGSPSGGIPGTEDLLAVPLFFAESSPGVLTTPLAAFDPIELRFNRRIDPASVTPNAVRVLDASLQELPAQFTTPNGGLRIDSPAAGWPPQSTLLVELHAGLRAQDGTPLSAPLALPLRTQ
jgi:hypothetical protein